MNRKADDEHDFNKATTSLQSAIAQLTWFRCLSPSHSASFIGPISTAC
jgi:hypothetical protein